MKIVACLCLLFITPSYLLAQYTQMVAYHRTDTTTAITTENTSYEVQNTCISIQIMDNKLLIHYREGAIYKLNITDIKGNSIFQKRINGSMAIVDMRSFSSDPYLIQIETTNGLKLTQKFK